jgi:hypothetical protein
MSISLPVRSGIFPSICLRWWNIHHITVVCSLCSCRDGFTWAARPYLVHYVFSHHRIPYLIVIAFSQSCTPYDFAPLSSCTEYRFARTYLTRHRIQQQRFPYDITSTADILIPFWNTTSYFERYCILQYGAFYSAIHCGWILAYTDMDAVIYCIQEGELDIDLAPLFTDESHTPLNSTAQLST